jgi:drug/metabolite transporter (DMT)-like permease
VLFRAGQLCQEPLPAPQLKTFLYTTEGFAATAQSLFYCLSNSKSTKMSNKTTAPQWLISFAFANIFIIWGSTFLAVTYALEGFPPFLLSGLRFASAGLILLGWRYAKGERISGLKALARNAVPGILILSFGTSLVAWCEQYVSSSEAAIVGATGPFWFIAIDRDNWKKYFSNKSIVLGLVIGFAGLLVFFQDSMRQTLHNGNSIRNISFFVLALSSVSWVLGSLFSKHYPAKGSTALNTAQQLLAASAVSMLISGLHGEWKGFSFAQVPPSAWAAMAFLVIMGSVVTYLSYIWLLSVRPPALVSVHTYINPVVAVFLGWLLRGEGISGIQLFGLAVILTGVFLTNMSRYRLSNRKKVVLRRLIGRIRLKLPLLVLSRPRSI